MAFDPPWRLDPFQNIVGVGWGGADILVLYAIMHRNRHDPEPVTIEDLDFTASAIDMFAETIHEHDDHAPVPVIENPVNGDMLAHSFMWNVPPYKITTGEEDTREWAALIFFNLRKIKSFLDSSDPEWSFTIHTPASTHDTESGFVYYAWIDLFGAGWEFNRDNPHTTGAVIDDLGNTGIVTSPLRFTDAAARDLFLGWNAGAAPPWLSRDEPASGDVFDFLNMDFRAATYIKHKNFSPRDFDNEPLWTFTPEDSDRETRDSGPGVEIPALTWTVRVNLHTHEVEIERPPGY